MDNPDVHIIGSGFSGSLLAYHLSKKMSVKVIERNTPGEKYCCGGGLPRSLINDLGLKLDYTPIDQMIYHYKKKQYWYPIEYAVVNRGALDRAMSEKAKEAGVDYQKAIFKDCDSEKLEMSLEIDKEVIIKKFNCTSAQIIN